MVRVQDLIPTAWGVIHGRPSLAVASPVLNGTVTHAVDLCRFCPAPEGLSLYGRADGIPLYCNHNCRLID
jgi:hypothetical protein